MDDRTPGGVLRVMQQCVGLDDILTFGITPIDFDIIATPVGELTHVFKLVAFCARHGLAAGMSPGIRIERVFQASLVDIVAEPAQPAGISFGVRGQLAVARTVETDPLVRPRI